MNHLSRPLYVNEVETRERAKAEQANKRDRLFHREGGNAVSYPGFSFHWQSHSSRAPRSPLAISQSALGSSSQQALFIAVLGRWAQRLCEMSQKWHVQKDLISRLQTVQTNGQHSRKNIRTLTKPGSLWHRRWSVIRWPKRRAAWRRP